MPTVPKRNYISRKGIDPGAGRVVLQNNPARLLHKALPETGVRKHSPKGLFHAASDLKEESRERFPDLSRFRMPPTGVATTGTSSGHGFQ